MTTGSDAIACMIALMLVAFDDAWPDRPAENGEAYFRAPTAGRWW